MTDIRPLLLGYIRAHILMTGPELADAKQNLVEFAKAEGYTLGTIYVERVDRVPAAFQTLLAEVTRQQAAAVVVPGLHHLAILGTVPNLKHHIENATGARVLAARASP